VCVHVHAQVGECNGDLPLSSKALVWSSPVSGTSFKLTTANGAGQPSALNLKTLKPCVIESAAVDAAIIVEGFIAKRPTQMLVAGWAVTIVREDTWQDAVRGRGQLTPPP